MLGLSETAIGWLEGRQSAADVRLPDDDRAVELLEFCGVCEQDRDDMLAARPDRSRDAGWWAVLGAMVADLEQRTDEAIPGSGFRAWPAMSESPVGSFVAAWALLAGLPRLLELHARRGVPESISRASASALGGVLGTHRDVTGQAGVGLFPLWGPPLRFTGTDVQIGRHSFTRARLELGDGPSGYGLMIHVPPIGPLDAAASEESITAAERYFADWYPEEPVSHFSCTSWLLDPQLGEYLEPESNILRFQRRFRLLPQLPAADPFEDDREMMRLGLHVQPPEGALGPEDLARIPQHTMLQRAFVTHLRSGRHWSKRTGLRLPAAA
ncbi:acyltransferase domain-containing protein [Kribbella sp. NPDC050820]|uniref:acyltransferase domain-containing protein n=1 Tax=Kribbella sp. NPDC050820 TaxID=3155408 RepID=UPI0033D8CB57